MVHISGYLYGSRQSSGQRAGLSTERSEFKSKPEQNLLLDFAKSDWTKGIDVEV